jgi:hypothetical protein
MWWKVPALCSKLRVPVEQKASRLELSGAHEAVKALGSTCTGVWASRRHSSYWRYRRTKPAGSKRFGAWFPAQASGIAVLWCCCSLGRAKLWGSRRSGAWSPLLAWGSSVLWHCCQGNRACWLVPSVTHEAARAICGPCLYRSASFPGISGRRLQVMY